MHDEGTMGLFAEVGSCRWSLEAVDPSDALSPRICMHRIV